MIATSQQCALDALHWKLFLTELFY